MTPAEREQLLNAVKGAADAGDFARSLSITLNAVEFAVPPVLDARLYETMAKFTLGVLTWWAGRRDEAIDLIDASGALSPGDWDIVAPSDHHLYSTQLEAARCAAAGHTPSMLITSLPKSASAHISNVLSTVLEIPVLRASMGQFPHAVVIPRWLRQVAGGGCVTHEHFAASPRNLAALEQEKVERIFVQVRDPRAALYSFFHFMARLHKTDAHFDAQFESLVESYYQPAVAWIDSWLEARDALGADRVIFIDYALVRDEPLAAFASILERSGAERHLDRVRAFLERLEKKGAQPTNFRSGNDEEWKTTAAPEMVQRLHGETTDRVRAYFDF